MLQAVECEELPCQHMHQLLDQVLQRDLQPLLQQQQQALGDAGQQYVMGRALQVGAELQQVATQQHRERLLQAAATAGAASVSSCLVSSSWDSAPPVSWLHGLPQCLFCPLNGLCPGMVLWHQVHCNGT